MKKRNDARKDLEKKRDYRDAENMIRAVKREGFSARNALMEWDTAVADEMERFFRFRAVLAELVARDGGTQ